MRKKAPITKGLGAPVHQTNVFLILPQRPDFAFLWRHFIVEGEYSQYEAFTQSSSAVIEIFGVRDA